VYSGHEDVGAALAQLGQRLIDRVDPVLRRGRGHRRRRYTVALEPRSDHREAGTVQLVKGFDGAPFKHLQHADVWLPQLANLTYLEIERE
jgi:hypothetical protein